MTTDRPKPMPIGHPLTEGRASFYWCLHCECTFLAVSWETNDWGCPNSSGCDGDEMDAQAWLPGAPQEELCMPLQEGAYAGEQPTDGRWFPCWPNSYTSRPEYVPEDRWRQLRPSEP